MSVLLPVLLLASLIQLSQSASLATPTTPPQLPSLRPQERQERRGLSGIISSVTAVPKEVSSFLDTLPSDVINGILPEFTSLPTPDEVKSRFNLTDEEIDKQPLQVLNIPPYANWTDSGWSLHVFGTAYKQPPLNDSQLDDAAKIFLPNLNTSSLNSTERAESRNVTAGLLAIPQKNVSLSFTVNFQKSGAQLAAFTLKNNTDDIGEFEEWVSLGSLSSGGVEDGNKTRVVRDGPAVWSTADGNTGNASAYFVPPQGLTIVSDIDDILRITQIYSPQDGLDNSFAFGYKPWMNMPDIFRNWSRTIEGAHFHYLTTTPEQVTRAYESFIFADYPLGSFDIRPENFTTVDQTLQIRKVALFRVLETFPQRKFVLIADTSNADVMKDYPLAKATFGDRVSCILLRNTSATDPKDHFPYDTSGFEGISNSSYMFFRTPDDLKNIDIVNGGCRNSTFEQNVTFGYQGLPSDLQKIKSSGGASVLRGSIWVVGMVGMIGGLWGIL